MDGDTEGGYSADDDVQLVNFGTPKNPQWLYATGFWLNHNVLTNGPHTLQLRALLTLNNYVGPLSQYLNLTNRSVHITTTNDLTFAGFSQLIIGETFIIVAQSANHASTGASTSATPKAICSPAKQAAPSTATFAGPGTSATRRVNSTTERWRRQPTTWRFTCTALSRV